MAYPVVGIGIENETHLGLIPSKGSLNNKVVLACSTDKVVQLVTETLGDPVEAPHAATAEFVSMRPLRTAEDALAFCKHQRSLMTACYQAAQTADKILLRDIITQLDDWEALSDLDTCEAKCHVRSKDSLTEFYWPSIQVTRSIPLAGAYAFAKHMAKSKHQHRLVDSAAKIADEYVEHYRQSKSLSPIDKSAWDEVWQVVFLTVWMVSCYTLVQLAKPLPKSSSSSIEQTPGKQLLDDLTRFSGKSFFDTLPRFHPGDILRVATQSEAMLTHFKQKNTGRFRTSAMGWIARRLQPELGKFVETIESKRTTALASQVKSDGTLKDLEHAISSCLLPGYLSGADERYPDEPKDSFGEHVDAAAGSVCLSSTQFAPRYEITQSDKADPRLQLLFETRKSGMRVGQFPDYEETFRQVFAEFMILDKSEESIHKVFECLFDAHRAEVISLADAKRSDWDGGKQSDSLKTALKRLSQAQDELKENKACSSTALQSQNSSFDQSSLIFDDFSDDDNPLSLVLNSAFVNDADSSTDSDGDLSTLLTSNRFKHVTIFRGSYNDRKRLQQAQDYRAKIGSQSPLPKKTSAHH
jgi:hypothetical protein